MAVPPTSSYTTLAPLCRYSVAAPCTVSPLRRPNASYRKLVKLHELLGKHVGQPPLHGT
jgi:hypothetical protein